MRRRRKKGPFAFFSPVGLQVALGPATYAVLQQQLVCWNQDQDQDQNQNQNQSMVQGAGVHNPVRWWWWWEWLVGA